MPLNSGLRVRRDVEARAREVDEEALYLLTPADGSDRGRKNRKRKQIPFCCSKYVIFIILFVASLAIITSSRVSS